MLTVRINEALRQAKLGRTRISLNWRGVAVSRPYHIDLFKDVNFFRGYVERFGTKKQVELVRFNELEVI